MKWLKRLVVLTMGVMMCASFTGCGGNNEVSEGLTSITFWASPGVSGDKYYREMVNTYNNGQGKIDKVYVKYIPKGSDYSSNVATTLQSSRAPELMVINDKYFKNYAVQGYFVNIEELLASEETLTKDERGDAILDLSEMPSRLVDRFRIDSETRRAGTGTTLYGVPNGDDPSIIFYNTAYFESAGVNVISVPEDELEAYNNEHGTSYQPHGYAEYLLSAAPAVGLKTSRNLAGKEVVKVFNNRISMNWEELLCLSKYFTKAYNSSSSSTYGFLNEWWFSYGWSVGGDCIGYNKETGHYEFTLGDENPNYLVIEDVTVNGCEYKAGEVLLYEDKTYVAEQGANGDYMSSLYELPSMYDAFAEFCALSQTKGKAVDSKGKVGYGISPSPSTLVNTSKMTYFTSGNVAILCDSYSLVPETLGQSKLKTWDFAPLYQYKEYEGGSLDDSGNLKIIGETYSGETYTGELKTAGSQNVAVVGYKATQSMATCYVIPSKSNSSKHQASWKFIQWAASVNGQSIISKSNNIIPNQINYAHSDEFVNIEEHSGKNILALADTTTYTDIGDWSYIEDGDWVNPWANVLNTDVRNGDMMLDTFFSTVLKSTNTDLANEKYKIVITTK